MGVIFAKGAARKITTNANDNKHVKESTSTSDTNWRDILNSVAEMDLWGTDRRADRPVWREYLDQAEGLLQQKRTPLPQEIVESVLSGNFEAISGRSLPSMKKKVVMFVSSTFTDTKAERNSLMKDVYPYLRSLCRILGLDFGSVDMRWGVNEEVTLSHGTAAVCIQEVDRCLQESAGPAFLAVLGHKYGHQPLPTEILEDEFLKLRSMLAEMGEDLGLVDEYYRKDDNMTPSHYVLKPRNPDQKDWWDVFEKLQTQFRLAAPKCLSKDAAEKYFISVTEDEIKNGLFDNEDRDSQAVVLRRILGDVRAPIHRHRHIIDVLNAEINEEAQDNLELLKGKKINESLSSNSVLDYEYSVPDEQKVMEYVRVSCDAICENLTKSILKNYEENLHVKEDGVFSEILQNALTTKEKCDTFVGREELITKVLNYNNNTVKNTLVVHGQSGCGKTALMAMCAKQTKKAHPNAIMAIRFLGTTVASGSARAVLLSLCHQITRAFGKDVSRIPSSYKELVPFFRECLGYASESKTIHLFLDSLDQLSNEDFGKNLKWLSLKEELPAHVHIVVSTLPGQCLTTLNGFLPDGNFVVVQQMTTADGPLILQNMLAVHHRTLTEEQNKVVLDAFHQCPLPLYMRLAVDIALTWHSYDNIGPKELAPDMPGLIGILFERLESKYGLKLVRHALSYITLAKHGLSVAELEDILSCDDEVLNDVFTFWEPPFIRIPPLLWIRIRNELGNYLVERGSGGTTSYGWYHRQFWETAESRFVNSSADSISEVKARRALADYFEGKWYEGKLYARKKGKNTGTRLENRNVASQPLVVSGTRTSGRNLNRRKLSELSHQLLKLKDWDKFKEHIGNLEFIEAKFEVQLGYECVAEFTEASKISNDSTIKAVAKFIGASLSHILREPHSIFQLASQQVSANPVHGLFKIYPIESLPHQIVVDQNKNEIEDPCQLTVQGHTSGVRSCCYSPSGDLIASCAEDSSLRIWDSFSGAEVVTVTGLPGPTYPGLADPYHGERPCCFSKNGINVATGSEDGWLQIWDLAGAELYKNKSHSATVTGIVYLVGETELFTCSKDQTGKFWSISDGTLVPVATVNLNVQGLGCDISGDGSLIAVSGSGGLATIDVANKSRLSLESGYTNLNLGCCFDPTGKEIATGGDNSAITLWNASSGSAKSQLTGHRGWVWCVKYTEDGSKLISCSSDRTMKMWDLKTKSCIISLGGHTHRISWASVKPGNDMFVSGSLDSSLKIWDLVAVANGQAPPVGGLHYSILRVSPNQTYIATCQGWSTSCTVTSPNGEHVGATPNHGGFIGDLSISTDSRVAVSVDTGHTGNYTANAVYDARVKVGTLPNGEVVAELPASGPTSVCCTSQYIIIGTAEGKLIAFQNDGYQTAVTWNFFDGDTKATGYEAYIKSMSATSDGHLVTVADKTAKVWNISEPASGVALITKLEGSGEVMSICKYSPDDTYLIISDLDGSTSVYDVHNNYAFVQSLLGHSSRLSDMVFSPSGRYLATVGVEMSLRIWDTVEDFKNVCTWFGPVNQMGFIAENMMVLGEATGTKRYIELPVMVG